jgi:hypothetical protein
LPKRWYLTEKMKGAAMSRRALPWSPAPASRRYLMNNISR